MSPISELDSLRRIEALQTWVKECRQAMKMRWPEIDFDGQVWPLNTKYKTRLENVRFKPLLKDFSGKDAAYILAFRCLVCGIALDGKTKRWHSKQIAWRLLKGVGVPLASLTRDHLVQIERNVLQTATARSSAGAKAKLKALSTIIDTMTAKGAIPSFAWSPSPNAYDALNLLHRQNRKAFRKSKSIDILDRQIEALSDATQAMLKGDRRLSDEDRSAIAVMNIMMCAPSRINEPLCLHLDDRFTIQDYATRPDAENPNRVFQAHQLLLMKGSKGADWSGKPILKFMVSLVGACWQIILDAGQQSRMLVKHYESQPNRLYLPASLEHLRGTPISVPAFWQITNLSAQQPTDSQIGSARRVWNLIANSADSEGVVAVTEVPHPRAFKADGRRNPAIKAVHWSVLESYLLQRVQERLELMRRVSGSASYEGPLSEMLTLVDRRQNRYLPSAWSDFAIRTRFKTQPAQSRKNQTYSVFAKLDLKMSLHGELVECFIEPHDTRRWLTTKALQSRERLSDVLINQWANRLDLSQLPDYDYRADEQKADQSSMPIPASLNALSQSLTELQSLRDSIDLKTHFVSAHGNDLVVTDLQAMEECGETRPTARCGNEIVVLTPTRYGVCLHQHYKTPCLSYRNCDRCSLLAVCKGHKPTNDAWRERQARTNRVIFLEVDRHVKTHNRGIADDSEGLESHILTLMNGLGTDSVTQNLIDSFEEIKDKVQDPNFRQRLQQAFISQKIVEFLDDPDIPDGSLIRYNNRSMHESPGHERAMESRLGPRREREQHMEEYYEKHPAFAPRLLNSQEKASGSIGIDELGEDATKHIERDEGYNG